MPKLIFIIKYFQSRQASLASQETLEEIEEEQDNEEQQVCLMSF